MSFKTVPVPDRSERVIEGHLRPANLWLWDSWLLHETEKVWYLYCLALAKTDADGEPVIPVRRNDYNFHIRAYRTSDDGQNWQDRGAVIEPFHMMDGSDSRNVWSGSVARIGKNEVAFGYTGVREAGPDRPYLQSICMATGSAPDRVDHLGKAAVSCPLRDYDMIKAMGYYLGPRHELGHNQGEEGGPILAWRDPYLFHAGDDELHAVWSAKLGPRVPAIARAKLTRGSDGFVLEELFEPIALPDAQLMTQAEVPKLYRDPVTEDWLLLISACDRQYEGQPITEVSHVHRLYRARALQGPWSPYKGSDSKLMNLDGLFGASMHSVDATGEQMRMFGPYTENAGPELQLSFGDFVFVPLRASTEQQDGVARAIRG